MDKFIENAIAWALSKKDQAEYPLRCLAFVEDAYEKGNNIELFGGSTAAESAEEYGFNTMGCPPKGSFVFYQAVGSIDRVEKDWGHVGLCIGDGEVIHAWNVIRIDNYLEVKALSTATGWRDPKYLGWTPPERFLKGYQPR